MAWPDRLPTSKEEVGSLVFVATVAGLSALSRLLYGRNELRWRYLIGSLLVAMSTSVLVYSVMVNAMGEVGGHASAAVGAAVGLFTDDVLKRMKGYVITAKVGKE